MMASQETEDLSPKLSSQTTPRNPYLIASDGATAVFRRPLWQSVVSVLLSIPVCALGFWPVYAGVFLIERRGVELPSVVALLTGLLLIWFGICYALSAGASKITFDLTRRTYSRLLLAPPPLLGRRVPDMNGWGNPFTGRTLHGQMSDLEGVQIIERQDSTARYSSPRAFVVYVVPVDRNIPPCVVYSSPSLQDALAQSQEISALLDLPSLKTLLIDSSNPSDYKASKPPARNPYLASYDGKTAVFRLPRSQTILMLCLTVPVLAFVVWNFVRGGVLAGPMTGKMHFLGVMLLLSLIPISISAAGIISSGANALTLDLAARTYRRLLLGPPWTLGQNLQKYTGQGNLLQRRMIDGAISEIEGVTLLQVPYGARRFYSVQLVWADDAHPPFVVYYGGDQQEASLQALQVGSMLSLPQLEHQSAYTTTRQSR